MPVEEKHISIRIHPHEDYAEDLVEKFKDYCDHNLVKDYIMTYEDDAARPHYHTYLKTDKTGWKLKQTFKQMFPLLKGNKYFAFTQISDDYAYKKYICKGGDYKIHSDNYTLDDLEEFKTDWLKIKGEIAHMKQTEAKKKQKKNKDLEDQFIQYISELVPNPPGGYTSSFLDLDNAIIVIKGFILEQKILNFNPQFIQKYYRLLVRICDPEKYKLYVQEFVRSSLEKNIFVI